MSDNTTNNTTGLMHKLKVLAKSSEIVRMTIRDEDGFNSYIGRLRHSRANIFTVFEKGRPGKRIIPENVQTISLMRFIWRRK